MDAVWALSADCNTYGKSEEEGENNRIMRTFIPRSIQGKKNDLKNNRKDSREGRVIIKIKKLQTIFFVKCERGRKKLGRPRRRWVDRINMQLLGEKEV